MNDPDRRGQTPARRRSRRYTDGKETEYFVPMFTCVSRLRGPSWDPELSVESSIFSVFTTLSFFSPGETRTLVGMNVLSSFFAATGPKGPERGRRETSRASGCMLELEQSEEENSEEVSDAEGREKEGRAAGSAGTQQPRRSLIASEERKAKKALRREKRGWLGRVSATKVGGSREVKREKEGNEKEEKHAENGERGQGSCDEKDTTKGRQTPRGAATPGGDAEVSSS
ncbi:hypothetical protein TGP89_420100 [Toxoplasma gondii p89]|uniref:Uncharacterized protein n=1 Tax=Toxoplasma gondii p89 TaxID=943119 RepID=A0A086JVI7_TOXGO|nr:hypothetical protein TGP89_420100 [Toxoplasma gondii p89]